jgi:peptide/nickel transport system permease protein
MTVGMEIPPEGPTGPAAPLSAAMDKAAAYYETPQWRLMWRRFRKHRVALWMLHVVIILYVLCLNCDFLSPYDPSEIHGRCVDMPPQVLRVGLVEGSAWPRLYVHPFVLVQDPVTLERHYWVNRQVRTPVRWLVRGQPWKFMGLVPSDVHLFGVDSTPAPAAASGPTSAPLAEAPATAPAAGMPASAPGLAGEAGTPTCFLLGTDKLGQDMFSRILHGGRISLLLGLTGELLTFVLGVSLGGISGYYGGKVDIVIQRVVEILQSVPSIPIWLAMAAAIPKEWTSLEGYFAMTMILAIIGWTGLCRVVRGKLLALREEDYARAALLAGASERRVIFVHLIPNFLSHIIASMTLAIPGIILAETSLSFLGLGLRPPIVSWGVLLQDAQSVSTVQNQPWMLLPAVMVIIAVLAFNFAGDGLRDAADPYAN